MEQKERKWQDELERFMMYDSNPVATKTSTDGKGDKLTVAGRGGSKGHKKLSPRCSKMISPTVTRRHFLGMGKGKRSGKDGGEPSSSYAKKKEEVQRTLAEAGKLLAMGAVEPLVVLSSVTGCRHKDTT